MNDSIEFVRYSNVLGSIKSVQENYAGKVFLSRILFQFLDKTNFLRVEAMRANYSLDEVKKLEQQNRSKFRSVIDIEERMSFSISTSSIDDSVVELLTAIWFAFEQPVFYFLMDVESLVLLQEYLKENIRYYGQIVEKIDSIMLFKSTEEDVIWIAKNKNRDFGINL